MPKLTDTAKFLLVLGVPLAVLFAGVNIAVLALAEASESIKWLPASMFHVSNILLALSVVVASVGVVRILFAFSRYAEVRSGYTKTFQTPDTTLDTRPMCNQLACPVEPQQSITDGRNSPHDAATDVAKSAYRRAVLTRLSVSDGRDGFLWSETGTPQRPSKPLPSRTRGN